MRQNPTNRSASGYFFWFAKLFIFFLTDLSFFSCFFVAVKSSPLLLLLLLKKKKKTLNCKILLTQINHSIGLVANFLMIWNLLRIVFHLLLFHIVHYYCLVAAVLCWWWWGFWLFVVVIVFMVIVFVSVLLVIGIVRGRICVSGCCLLYSKKKESSKCFFRGWGGRGLFLFFLKPLKNKWKKKKPWTCPSRTASVQRALFYS